MKSHGKEKNVKNIVRSEHYVLTLVEWANTKHYGDFSVVPDTAGIPLVFESNTGEFVSEDDFINIFKEEFNGECKN